MVRCAGIDTIEMNAVETEVRVFLECQLQNTIPFEIADGLAVPDQCRPNPRPFVNGESNVSFAVMVTSAGFAESVSPEAARFSGRVHAAFSQRVESVGLRAFVEQETVSLS